jgi:hypothetical protein
MVSRHQRALVAQSVHGACDLILSDVRERLDDVVHRARAAREGGDNIEYRGGDRRHGRSHYMALAPLASHAATGVDSVEIASLLSENSDRAMPRFAVLVVGCLCAHVQKPIAVQLNVVVDRCGEVQTPLFMVAMLARRTTTFCSDVDNVPNPLVKILRRHSRFRFWPR